MQVASAFAALALLCACKGTPPAVDASTPDASLDATDASDADTERTWHTRLGSACDVRFADDPAWESSTISWVACTDGPPTGCREASTSMAGAIAPLTLRAVGAYTAAGTISMLRVSALPNGKERTYLGPPDGPARVVIETACAGGHYAVGDDSAVLEAGHSFYTGPFSNDPTWDAPTAKLGSELGEVIFDPSLTVTGRSVRAVDARSRVLRTDPTTPLFKALEAQPIFKASLDGVVAKGDVAVFRAETIPEQLGVQVGSSAPVPWYTVARGEGVSAPARDRDTLYWLQGHGRDKNNVFTSIDVFSAPFPTSSARPIAKKVGATGLTTSNDPIAGAGRVAWRTWLDADHSAVDVLDVASSRTVRFTPPRDKTIGRLVWVDDREVAVEIFKAGSRSMTGRMQTWRIALAGLPPP